MSPKPQIKTLWKNWDIVERKIKEEINWLRKNIETFLQEEKNAPVGCRECFLRKIAILIVSGQVKASNITKKPPLESFWLNVKTKKKKEIYHGSD